MSVSKAPTKRLYQQVAAKLLKEIATGKYEINKRLPSERELAELFDVSRPTIREAVIALEIAGNVEVRNGAGVFVVDKTSENENKTNDIGPFELLEARRLFEGEAAALAATLITDEQIEELEQAADEMDQENKDNVQNHEAADRKFHMLIAYATQNNAIISTIEYLWDVRNHSPMCLRLLDEVRNQGIKPRVDEHREVLAALRDRDPVAARACMREHLTRVTDMVFKATEIEAIEKAKRALEEKRSRYLRN